LILYGLYKQSTIGDCNVSKPNVFDFKGQAKWDAWESNRGLDKLIAMRRYIRKVKNILDLVNQ
jgi:diazepam-binding inhibitor (GABA receptor modulating acyl-CoA-binding protein)